MVFEKVQIHNFTKVKNCAEQHNLICSLFNNSAYWIIACCCLLLFDYSSWMILTWRTIAVILLWEWFKNVIEMLCLQWYISVLFITNSWIFVVGCRYGVHICMYCSYRGRSRWMWLWKICSPDGKYVREHVRGLLLDYSTYQILWSLVNYSRMSHINDSSRF